MLNISVTIEENVYSESKQLTCDDKIIAITVANEGDWLPIYGWNVNPADSNTIETSRSWGLGYPFNLGGNKLNIDFSSSSAGNKKFRVTVFKKQC